MSVPDSAPGPKPSLITLTHVIYGLHALSAVTGLISPAFVLTAFLTGWPSILAVVLNYLKRDEAYGTYLQSHFRWQIRTFWYALLWLLVLLIFSFTIIGLPVALVIGLATGIWVLYRILRGWLRLLDAEPMPE